MTQSTEQEIAAAWNAQADELNQWDELDLQEKIEWSAKFGKNQAARRAPVVRVEQSAIMPKGESAAAKLRAMATNYPAGHSWDKLDAKACIRGALEIEALRAMLAAAPQPPEAAPVQMPEPVGWVDDGGMLFWTEDTPPDGENIYTEHQVRQLLAAHGVK